MFRSTIGRRVRVRDSGDDWRGVPFVSNVQQKVPVTERRNELGNSYREDLMEGLINGQLDLLDDV